MICFLKKVWILKITNFRPFCFNHNYRNRKRHNENLTAVSASLRLFASVGFCRGSRVEGKMSSVEGKMSRVEDKMLRVICFVNISRLVLPARCPTLSKIQEWPDLSPRGFLSTFSHSPISLARVPLEGDWVQLAEFAVFQCSMTQFYW